MANALPDLRYLQKLDDRDDEQLFEALDEAELRVAVSSLVRWIYPHVDGGLEWFEETVARGTSDAERDRCDDDITYYAGGGVDAGIDVDIEVREGFNVDRIER